MMCWHVVLLIDDSLVTRETQQSITVEQMSEKGRPSCYNGNSNQLLLVDLSIVHILVENLLSIVEEVNH